MLENSTRMRSEKRSVLNEVEARIMQDGLGSGAIYGRNIKMSESAWGN